MADKVQKIEYPCTDCEQQQSCMYKECQRYREWFHQEWESIQAAVKKAKEIKGGGQVKNLPILWWKH